MKVENKIPDVVSVVEKNIFLSFYNNTNTTTNNNNIPKSG